MSDRKLIIAIDFDGTIVQDSYPFVGKLMPHAKQVIKRLSQKGDIEFVLWTCRSEDRLQKAIDFLYMNDLLDCFVAINENVPLIKNQFGDDSHNSPKIFADLYVDDKAFNAKIDWLAIQQKINKLQKIKIYPK